MGELLKCGGSGTIYLLKHLFGVVWQEVVPIEWREGLIANLFKVIRKSQVITEALQHY